MNAASFEDARRNMVDNQIRCAKILDPDTLDLIESMPREEFVPEQVRSIAYMEGRLPLPCGQEMLSPLQEAHILQALALRGHERVLEIGTGTGFLTAMLAMRAREVVSCEIHDELASMAEKNLAEHGINNARVVRLNAMDAEAVAAEPALKGGFDAMVLGVALKEIPAHLLQLLNADAQVVAFIGENPVVTIEHIIRKGMSEQHIRLAETLLKSAEGLPKKREFVF
ncbi:MAG: protein-L-isoaspartate O-methyltransferase [Zetaproteobacteria bacterium]|nr:MAG: protein-L-isoaspartate O-methyltransferase [Zetaproteobacteria bacterium]